MFCKTLETRIFGFINDHELITSADKVLVGLSGGPDSVLLTILLGLYIEQFGGELACCHVNHGLRGGASDRDEAFAKDFAAERGLECVVRRIDAASHSVGHRLSLEESARLLRIKALEATRGQLAAEKIALGHTADDAVETFLFNFFRGTGKRGLSGIQAKRGRMIRPLLPITREEVIRYLKKKGTHYRIDATNWQCAFSRNFIRHELVPFVERKLKRKVRSSILNLMSIMEGEEQFLDRMVATAFASMCSVSQEGVTLRREDFRRLDKALQRRMIVRCFAEAKGEAQGLHFKEIEAVRKAAAGNMSGRTFSCHGVAFLIGAESILIARERSEGGDVPCEVTLPLAGEITFRDRYAIRTGVIGTLNGDLADRDRAYFDLQKLVLPLTVRSRNNGDAFIPFGMEHEKKVKELLVDEKVPFFERDAIPVISDARGIIWVAGIRRGAAAKVDAHTSRILKIEKRDIVRKDEQAAG